MPVPEHILAKYRDDIPNLTIYGVPITQMTEDELRCMLVLVAKREQEALARGRKDIETLRAFGSVRP